MAEIDHADVFQPHFNLNNFKIEFKSGLGMKDYQTYHKAPEYCRCLYDVTVVWVGFLWWKQATHQIKCSSLDQLWYRKEDGDVFINLWTNIEHYFSMYLNMSFCTSTCLSSSCSRVGYLSSLMKGLLRLEVRVRIPGAVAPWLSMNLSSSSL